MSVHWVVTSCFEVLWLAVIVSSMFLNWLSMDWIGLNQSRLGLLVSVSPVMELLRINIETSIWRIVYHYENYQLIDIHSQIITYLNWIIFLIWNRLWLVLLQIQWTSTLLNQLNWMIFLLLNQLNLDLIHSILFMILYYLVWFDIDIDSILDLPKLKSILLRSRALYGDSNDDRSESYYGYMNTLTMKSTNEWLWIDNEIFLLSLPSLHLVLITSIMLGGSICWVL